VAEGKGGEARKLALETFEMLPLALSEAVLGGRN
jgi:hypothetical protein